MRRRTVRRIVAAATPLVAVGVVALAGGFADASTDLDVVAVGGTHRTERADITVRRAWLADFRPDEQPKYTKPKKRLFVEMDFTGRGFESEGVIDGSGWGPGPAPQVVLPGKEPQKFKSVSDAATWESRYTVHPGVPERVVLEMEWSGAVPDKVRLELGEFRVDESNLLIEKVWVRTPAAYVDVPVTR